MKITTSNFTFLNANKSYLPLKSAILLLLMMFCILPFNAQEIQMQSVYNNVDKAPKFKGSPAKPAQFVAKHMVYPDEAWRNGVEGVVEIEAVVTEEGQLMELVVKKSVDPLLDLEALRVVELMQTWEPAQKGKAAVHSKVVVPVTFSLSPDERDFIQTLKKHKLNNKMPLYVLDNKLVHARVEIPFYKVRSVRVLKGKKAIEKYGEQARDGVVVITSKRGTMPLW